MYASTSSGKEKLIEEYNKIDPDDKIIFDCTYSYNTKHAGYTRFVDFEKNLNKERGGGNNRHNGVYPWVVDKENVPLLESLINDCNPIFDTMIGKITTEDSHILSEEDYANIVKMLSSSDKANVSLAVEMMSNCNVEESFDILALLFWFNNYEIRYASNWNTVNVKALRTRMKSFEDGCYNDQHAHSYDNFLRKLNEEDALTEFAVKNAIRKMFDRVVMNQMGFKQTSFFELDIKDIKLKPEWYEKVKRKVVGQELYDFAMSPITDDLPF